MSVFVSITGLRSTISVPTPSRVNSSTDDVRNTTVDDVRLAGAAFQGPQRGLHLGSMPPSITPSR
jgi:hypothetical protein